MPDPNVDRLKRTRLEDLDVKAKTILQAWHSARGRADSTIGYGQQHQEELGTFVSNDDYRWTDSYYRDSDYAYEPGPGLGSAESVNHQSEYLENNKNPELFRKIGSVLYNSQHGRQWHSGPIPPNRVSVNNPDSPFKKFAADHHKRRNAEGYNEDIYRTHTFRSGRTRTFKVGSKWVETKPAVEGEGPPTLEERWDSESFEGGPANMAKGGGSATTDISAKLSYMRPYEGEQNALLSINFGDVDYFIPDSPFNRDLYRGFIATSVYGTTYKDELGLSMFDYFFQLADVVGVPSYGNKSIRALYEQAFSDGDAPTIQATKIIRKNQWSQQDTNKQYDEGREYRPGDSYYQFNMTELRDGISHPLEFNAEYGDGDDPTATKNHQSFTLRRGDPDTIALVNEIHRALERNPLGVQYPAMTAMQRAAAIYNRNGKEYTRQPARHEAGHVTLGNYTPGLNKIDNAWPTNSAGIPTNVDHFDSDTPRNLEEIWQNLSHIVAEGPYSGQVGRGASTIELKERFGNSNLASNDYKLRFLRALDGTFANVPSKIDVKNQGVKGFNVGQVRPWNPRGNFGSEKEWGFQLQGDIADLLEEIHDYEQRLLQVRPGGNRINIVFNIKVNLDVLLQQNLLMPSDIHHIRGPSGYPQREDDLVTAIEEGTSSHINDNTFTKLYLQNRSALHSLHRRPIKGIELARNPPGTIGGVSVADLQGPVNRQSGEDNLGHVATSHNADMNSHVFEFAEDEIRANEITQERGFIDNIAGNVRGSENIAGLAPAVINDPDTGPLADKTSLKKTLAEADAQFFPFMFETVNKKGSTNLGRKEYKQYAYFQATIQSLNESYAPAWSSKHFFGRSEQMHTYTFTERSIDLSFVIFAGEIRRLQNLYERVNWLSQQTYPSYDATNHMKSGPIIRMTIGDMYSNLSGFIRSLSFDWNFLGPGGKWEISKGLRIPMACTVTMNFTVMHDDMPDRNYNFYPGPLMHPDGMISAKRGTSNDMPQGGPLIATANRKASGLGNIPADRQFLMDVDGPELRKEQYIDSMNMNRSKGTRIGDGASVDFVF